MEELITPPKYVKEIMKVLERRGHSAYLVGGCVRDMLMGLRPNDWDIATSAIPEEVVKLFDRTEETGLKHGTVTVRMSKGKKAEVTTFRTENGYSDHRRPDTVTYISDLTEDLSRRDFTINAIAIPLGGIIMDPFGGREDIERKLIRTVGDPEKRFSEDALRMFRAYRFAAKLGFRIEENTRQGIRKCAHLTSALAVERISGEMDKMLRSASPEIVYQVIECGLLDLYLEGRNISEAETDNLRLISGNKIMRWAGLCAILLKHGLIRSVPELLRTLRLDGASISAISIGIEIAKDNLPDDKYGWKMLLSKYGQNAVRCAAAAVDVLNGDTLRQKQIQSVIKSGDCFTLKRLAINGNDLIALGFQPGVELGMALEELLLHVIKNPGDNKKNILITRAVYMLQNNKPVSVK